MKADKTKALSAFSNSEKGFLHRDLYVFCFGPDGKVDAHPNPAMRGKEAKSLKGPDWQGVWGRDVEGSAGGKD
jgi:hypothetical protein